MKLSVSTASYGALPVSRRLLRRRRQCCVYLVFAMVPLVLALPASVNAKPGYKVLPGGMELILPVEQRGGYVISVSANDRQRVDFAVDRPSSTIKYSTRGRVSSRRIEANFGALGRIDVRLSYLVRHPSDPLTRDAARVALRSTRKGVTAARSSSPTRGISPRSPPRTVTSTSNVASGKSANDSAHGSSRTARGSGKPKKAS
jgi:hypothetical protein